MRRRVRQAQLDEAVGRGASYTAHLEAGDLGPPDRAACERIAAALGVDAMEVWRVAALERLQRADAEALETVLADHVAGAVVVDLLPDERRLVLALRSVDVAAGRDPGRASASLLRMANLVLTRAAAEAGPSALEAVEALDRLDEAPHRSARAALTVLVNLGAMLAAERERLGFSTTEKKRGWRRRGEK